MKNRKREKSHKMDTFWSFVSDVRSKNVRDKSMNLVQIVTRCMCLCSKRWDLHCNGMFGCVSFLLYSSHFARAKLGIVFAVLVFSWPCMQRQKGSIHCGGQLLEIFCRHLFVGPFFLFRLCGGANHTRSVQSYSSCKKVTLTILQYSEYLSITIKNLAVNIFVFFLK